MLPCRYSNKVACFTKVFLVSNIPLSDQYPNVQVTEPENLSSFLPPHQSGRPGNAG